MDEVKKETQQNGDSVDGPKWAETIERIADDGLKQGRPENVVLTGYAKFDKDIRGLRNGDLIVLASRVAMGKSALAMNILQRVVLGSSDRKPLAAGMFCLEVSQEDWARLMLFSTAGVAVWKSWLSPADSTSLSTASEQLKHAPIVVEESPWLDISDLCARARQMKSVHGINLLVIDSVQQLGDSRYSYLGREKEFGFISRGLKALARELNIPVLVLSQLGRRMEEERTDGIPRLCDLRDLGEIDWDADMVMLLFRPAYYSNEVDDLNLATIYVEKNRNRSYSSFQMSFARDILRFENRTWEDDASAKKRMEQRTAQEAPPPVRKKQKTEPKNLKLQ
jgi:replicative DNA helicase